jgi:hypothetical protein
MTLRIAAGILISLVPIAAGADSPPPLRLPEKALAAEHYTYVTKVADLPADIREGLARQLEQNPLHMADAGMPFNVSDAGIDPALPGHRLILAAVGPKYTVLHFERGGIAHTRWIIIFEKTAAGLNALWHGMINQEYGEPKQLEQAIRTGSLWKPPARPAQ